MSKERKIDKSQKLWNIAAYHAMTVTRGKNVEGVYKTLQLVAEFEEILTSVKQFPSPARKMLTAMMICETPKLIVHLKKENGIHTYI